MHYFLHSKKEAFTFAETMIALLIIGIVSAFVIPSLNNTFSKNVFQTSFADSYKSFNKALYNYGVEYSGLREEVSETDEYYEYYGAEDEDNGEKTKQTIPTIHDTRLTFVHLFDDNEKSAVQKISTQFRAEYHQNNCWKGKQIKSNFDGSGNNINLNDLECFQTSNGFIYAMEELSDTCSVDMRKSQNIVNKLSNSCAVLYIDVNGQNAPNAFGKDVYAFIVTNISSNSLYPVGGSLMKAIPAGKIAGVSTWKNNCDETNKDGRTCAGRIVEEGMRIKYFK